MRVHLVTMRYSPSLGGFDDRPLVEFMRDKELLDVREHFFAVHDLPHLACLLTYQEAPLPRPAAGAASGSPQPRREQSHDPFHGLAEGDRALYVTLRQWRSERAHRDGVPPYLILTNRQIVALVKAKPVTPSALQALDGLGPAKVERYGQAILARLHGTPAAPPATTADPAATA